MDRKEQQERYSGLSICRDEPRAETSQVQTSQVLMKSFTHGKEALFLGRLRMKQSATSLELLGGGTAEIRAKDDVYLNQGSRRKLISTRLVLTFKFGVTEGIRTTVLCKRLNELREGTTAV
jgi:hypothetical protein